MFFHVIFTFLLNECCCSSLELNLSCVPVSQYHCFTCKAMYCFKLLETACHNLAQLGKEVRSKLVAEAEGMKTIHWWSRRGWKGLDCVHANLSSIEWIQEKYKGNDTSIWHISHLSCQPFVHHVIHQCKLVMGHSTTSRIKRFHAKKDFSFNGWFLLSGAWKKQGDNYPWFLITSSFCHAW